MPTTDFRPVVKLFVRRGSGRANPSYHAVTPMNDRSSAAGARDRLAKSAPSWPRRSNRRADIRVKQIIGNDQRVDVAPLEQARTPLPIALRRMSLVVAGRADGAKVGWVVVTSVSPFDNVICNGGPARAVNEPQLAHVAIPLEHEGADGTPRGCAMKGATHIVLVLQLPAIPPDRLVHRRSHRNGGTLRLGTNFREDTYLTGLAGPVVK